MGSSSLPSSIQMPSTHSSFCEKLRIPQKKYFQIGISSRDTHFSCSLSSPNSYKVFHKSVPLAASIAILLWSTPAHAGFMSGITGIESIPGPELPQIDFLNRFNEENQKKYAEYDSRFKSSPLLKKLLEQSKLNKEKWLELELKLVADVGIVGAPNAGKSTLLSVVSAAKPEVANYPFTTLLPNLGVVSFDYDSTMVVADLPGLLEGAHRGFGLGHEFLRHTERCSALVHVVDGSSLQPDLEFDAVRLELKLFNPELSEKPYIVAYNKMDLPEAYENWESFKEKMQSRGITPFCMSAVKGEGTHEVICAAYEILRKSKKDEEEYADGKDMVNLDHVADAVQKQRSASISDFEIFHENNSNVWHVVGSGLQRFIQMTNWRYVDSERRFQHVLEACGVFKSLMKLGVKEGDTVIVGEMKLIWHDSSDKSGASRMKKISTDSIKWPDWK